jgi:hypothetical protein
MKRQTLTLAVSIFILVLPALAEQAVPEVVGSVSEVTVYRGQALVTRQIAIGASEGSSEVIVKNLPENLVSDSLFAQAPDGMIVSSVRYREKEIKEDTREEVQKLEAEIEEARKRQFQAQRDLDISTAMYEKYVPLWDMGLDSVKSDLERGVLQAEPIKSLTNHLEEKAIDWHAKIVEAQWLKRDIEKELAELEKKLNELKEGISKVEKEAVLNVGSEKTGKVVIKLSYLVNNAGWMPQYNLRARPDKSSAGIEYNAVIHQSSGEDWQGVELSLSTAQPTMEAAPPVLESMRVGTAAGGPVSGVPAEKISDVRKGVQQYISYRDLSREFEETQRNRRSAARKGKAAQGQISQLAVSNQMMELAADKDQVQVIKREAKRIARTEGVSVTYRLGGTITLPSKSEKQLVTIATIASDAEFIMLASPLLTDYVYLQGDITNASDIIFLPGPASMYRNGEFVGKSNIGLVTIGETFTAGFGVDSQIQIAREFRDKKIDTLWGNRVDKYDYRIAINNYKDSEVSLQLLDRIPYTEDEKLEITDFHTDTDLSKDAEYLRTQRDKGILRWDLTLKPKTFDEDATVVNYGYTMKYDNDYRITSVGK